MFIVLQTFYLKLHYTQSQNPSKVLSKNLKVIFSWSASFRHLAELNSEIVSYNYFQKSNCLRGSSPNFTSNSQRINWLLFQLNSSKTYGFLTTSERIEVNQFAWIRLIFEAKFGDDPLDVIQKKLFSKFSENSQNICDVVQFLQSFSNPASIKIALYHGCSLGDFPDTFKTANCKSIWLLLLYLLTLSVLIRLDQMPKQYCSKQNLCANR